MHIRPPFLIDTVIKKYLNYTFSSNQSQLKDKSDVHFYKLQYIGNLTQISNFAKSFVKKILTLS